MQKRPTLEDFINIERINKQQTYLVGEIKKANFPKITTFDRNRGAL